MDGVEELDDPKQALKDLKMLYEHNKIEFDTQDELRVIKAIYLQDKPLDFCKHLAEFVFDPHTNYFFLFLLQGEWSCHQTNNSTSILPKTPIQPNRDYLI